MSVHGKKLSLKQKRHPTECEELFAHPASDKWVISRSMKNSDNSTKRNKEHN